MPDVPVGGPECTHETLPIDSAIAVKGHYCQVPIFTEWLPYLGQIVFLWGMFEGKWNAFLEAMFASTDIIPETGWRKRKGKKRIHLFTEQVNKTFPKESAISIYMHELVGRFQNSNHMRPAKTQHFADQDAKLQRISFMESMV